MGKRFAHQRFADSRESIRKKVHIFEALGQIRANRVFPSHSNSRDSRPILAAIHFLEGRFAKRLFFFEADSQRIFAIRVRIANRFARIGPPRSGTGHMKEQVVFSVEGLGVPKISLALEQPQGRLYRRLTEINGAPATKWGAKKASII